MGGQINRQAGFHVVVVLIAAVVIGAVGLVGYRVASQDKNTSEPAQTNVSQTPSPGAAVPAKINKIDTSKLAFEQPAASTDPIGDRKGPFYHDVHTATSADGVHFTNGARQIINHASVPDATKLPSGQLVIYAVDGASRSSSGILMAVSDDNGQTWKAGSVKVSNERTGPAGADPQVLLTNDGKLRLYYVVFPAPLAPGQAPTGVNKVYSATSTDGINFTEEQGVRFEYAQITDPDIIKIGDMWFMYVAVGQRQIYATSTDALSFSYKAVAREKGSVSKTVVIGSGKYRQFYCLNGINSSTTTDGINWTDEGLNLAAPAGKTICDPSPLQLDASSWLMIYKLAS